MRPHPSLEELWNAPAPIPFHLSSLPPAAQRYLAHAIVPGMPLAFAVRLKMRGEMKLARWFPFEAEQVIRAEQEIVWSAVVRMLVCLSAAFLSASIRVNPWLNPCRSHIPAVAPQLALPVSTRLRPAPRRP